jgi:hypothetical protein
MPIPKRAHSSPHEGRKEQKLEESREMDYNDYKEGDHVDARTLSKLAHDLVMFGRSVIANQMDI